jgi:large subunit ribosomal protein L18
MIKRSKHKNLRKSLRTRSRILKGTKKAYKLVLSRSNKYISAQVVDLKTGATITGIKDKEADKVGKEIAQKAKKANVESVILDRGPYKYHGQIKQLADAAREGGLKF